ncbi:MAG: hypothetical protein EBR20_09835 [Bacteroidetes bacterium]|nr:hypothetical protein [Bacteroidota bacterium]
MGHQGQLPTVFSPQDGIYQIGERTLESRHDLRHALAIIIQDLAELHGQPFTHECLPQRANGDLSNSCL